MAAAAVHHIEIWVRDLAAAGPRWDWLLRTIGWTPSRSWVGAREWTAPDGMYLIVEHSPDVLDVPHERTRPGVNHVALAAPRASVGEVAAAAAEHGWSLLFADRHPYAGGPQHYAAFLEDADGYEVEVVATG